MEVSKEVGKKIKRARLKAGLTQQDLANALDLQSKVSVHGYESGATLIPLDVLIRLPEILGVPITDLLPDSVVTDHDERYASDPKLKDIAYWWTIIDDEAREVVHQNAKFFSKKYRR